MKKFLPQSWMLQSWMLQRIMRVLPQLRWWKVRERRPPPHPTSDPATASLHP
jgi:hypothetical protein